MTPFQFQVERLDMKTIAPKLKITAIQRCSRAKLDTIRSEFELLVAKQEKSGFYLKRGNQYLFYATPLDTISSASQETGATTQASVSFLTDSLQQVQYRDIDSMYNLIMIERAGQRRVNRFDLGKGEQKWEIKTETKKIGTFNCQKAIWKDDGFLVAEMGAFPLVFATSFAKPFHLRDC